MFLALFVFALAGGILLISISRASLEIMSKEEREGRLRTEPVIIDDVEIYKLPQSQTLPKSGYYWLKETRDWLWQKFSFDDEKIIQITLILADKKVSEARNLMEKEKYSLALENYAKAIEKLEDAGKLVNNMEKKDIFKSETNNQIKRMTQVYKKMIEEMGKNDKIDEQKYLLLLEKVYAFEKKQN
ncbi:MAG: DUF5667 domain-containing protein [Candidatus Shapirobacteria bacterium]|nr:DUF5667 domain-containing protein [Candidatus Shapirobacteria bacterium]